MTAWIGIIGTVLGVLLGGGLAWFNSRFQLRYQEQRDRKKLFLSKLEELYEAVSQFRKSYTTLSAEQLTSLSAHQSVQKSEGPTVPIEKLHMFVGFYAPELTSQLDQFMEAREQYGEVLVNRVGLERQSDKAIKEFLGKLYSKDRNLDKVCDDFQKEIVLLSKKYL